MQATWTWWDLKKQQDENPCWLHHSLTPPAVGVAAFLVLGLCEASSDGQFNGGFLLLATNLVKKEMIFHPSPIPTISNSTDERTQEQTRGMTTTIAYPVPISKDEGAIGITLLSAMKVLRYLYQEAGVTLTLPPKLLPAETPPAATTAASSEEQSSERKTEEKADLSTIITPTSQHIPGGLMKLVGSMKVPTRSGWKQLTANEVNGFFEDGNLPLCNLEPASFTQQYHYQELDVMRFGFVAVVNMAEKDSFTATGELTQLARRDLRKNCRGVSLTAEEEDDTKKPAKAGGSGGGGKDDKPQKFLKPLLLEKCAELWPHTPPTKAFTVTLESDPNQPRHKPLFQATLEITVTKRKVSFKGQWQTNKRDAENDACGQALTFLHTRGTNF